MDGLWPFSGQIAAPRVPNHDKPLPGAVGRPIHRSLPLNGGQLPEPSHIPQVQHLPFRHQEFFHSAHPVVSYRDNSPAPVHRDVRAPDSARFSTSSTYSPHGQQSQPVAAQNHQQPPFRRSIGQVEPLNTHHEAQSSLYALQPSSPMTIGPSYSSSQPKNSQYLMPPYVPTSSAATTIGPASSDSKPHDPLHLMTENMYLRADVQNRQREIAQLQEDRTKRIREGESLREEIRALRSSKESGRKEIQKLKKKLKEDSNRWDEKFRTQEQTIQKLMAEASVARSLARNLYWEKKERKKAQDTSSTTTDADMLTQQTAATNAEEPPVVVDHPQSAEPTHEHFEPIMELSSAITTEPRIKHEPEDQPHAYLPHPTSTSSVQPISTAPQLSMMKEEVSDLDLMWPSPQSDG